MKIIYKIGDLLEASEKYILHGCNARGVMASGVARAIRAKYPLAYERYRESYETQGEKLYLGQIIWVPGEHHTILNAITQENYGRDTKVQYVSYEAVRAAIRNVNNRAKTSKISEEIKNQFGTIDTVAMPLIGAGLGNGSWKVISSIIENESPDFQPVVYTLDGVIPTT